MDPLTTASAMASIIGLWCNFLSEYRYRTDKPSKDEFMAWLRDHRHDDVAKIIENNNHISTEIIIKLSQNHTQLISSLDYISKEISELALAMPDWKKITSLVAPDVRLKELPPEYKFETGGFCTKEGRSERYCTHCLRRTGYSLPLDDVTERAGNPRPGYKIWCCIECKGNPTFEEKIKT